MITHKKMRKAWCDLDEYHTSHEFLKNTPSHLKICSWNVNGWMDVWGYYKKFMTQKYLSTLSYDVLFLQEAPLFSTSEFYTQIWVAPHIEVLRRTTVRLEHDTHYTLAIVMMPDGGRVGLINLHLKAPTDDIRTQQMKYILKQKDEKITDVWFVGGDFQSFIQCSNATYQMKTIQEHSYKLKQLRCHGPLMDFYDQHSEWYRYDDGYQITSWVGQPLHYIFSVNSNMTRRCLDHLTSLSANSLLTTWWTLPHPMCKQLGWCMMVRNESEGIIDTLSPLSVCSHLVVADTYSDDGTPELITQWALSRHISLRLFSHEFDAWQGGFSSVRNELMQRINYRGCPTWFIMIDCHQMVEVLDVNGLLETLHDLAEDDDNPVIVIDLEMTLETNKSPIIQPWGRLIRHDAWELGWGWVDPIHEEIIHLKDGRQPTIRLPSGLIAVKQDRSKDAARTKERQFRDIDVLKKMIKSTLTHPRKPKWMFHLAQSYDRCGEYEKALDVYKNLRRVVGFEGQWVCELEICRCRAKLLNNSENKKLDVVIWLKSAMECWELKPERAEVGWLMAQVLVYQCQWYNLAAAILRKIIPLPPPQNTVNHQIDMQAYTQPRHLLYKLTHASNVND